MAVPAYGIISNSGNNQARDSLREGAGRRVCVCAPLWLGVSRARAAAATYQNKNQRAACRVSGISGNTLNINARRGISGGGGGHSVAASWRHSGAKQRGSGISGSKRAVAHQRRRHARISTWRASSRET